MHILCAAKADSIKIREAISGHVVTRKVRGVNAVDIFPMSM